MPASIQVGVEATGFEASLLKQGQSAFSKLGGIFGKNLDAAGFNNAFGSMNTNVRTFEKSLDFANRRVVAFGTSATLVYGAVRAFRELASATVDVEKSLVSINSIFGLSERQLDSFGKTLFDVARETGQSFQEAAKAAEEFSRQGLSVSETAKRTRDALILVRLTGLDASSAVETLTASINTFGKAGLDTTTILNKMVAVDQSFAVSTRDISEAIARAGSTINDSGASLDRFIGLVTAAKQITSRDGTVIGNSLKTIFTRLERATTLDQLESLGIAVRKLNGDTLPAADILNTVAQSYKNLGREQQNQIAELSGGVFQINQFKALMLDLGKANGIAAQATRTSTEATTEAIVRNAVLNQTLATQLQTLKTNATQAASVVGDLTLRPGAQFAVGQLNEITSYFTKLKDDDSIKGVWEQMGIDFGQAILKGIGNVLAGPGLVILLRLVTGAIKRTIPEVIGDLQTTIGFTNGGSNSIWLNEIGPRSAPTAPARGLRGGAQRAFLGGAAGGYLPAMAAERSAISMGVGGAPQTARPVVLPRFNFGGGQVGPLVANSSEYIAHMAGGGMGVFNQDMIRGGGLPRGATPVAAEGYVPNAAGGGFDYGDLRQAKGAPLGMSSISSLNDLFSTLSSASTTEGVVKFTTQIRDVAYSLNSISQKKVLNQLDETFTRMAAVGNINRSLSGTTIPLGGQQRLIELPASQFNYAGSFSEDAAARIQAKIAAEEVGGGSTAAQMAAMSRTRTRSAMVQARNAGFIQMGLLGASLSTGFLPDAVGGTRSGMAIGALSGGIQGASTGAALGSMFGPPGVAVGAVGGGIVGGLSGFVGKMEKSFDEITKTMAEAASKIKQEMDNVTQAFSLQDQIAEAREAGAPPSRLAVMQQKYLSTLGSIGGSSKELASLVIRGENDPEAREDAADLLGRRSRIGGAQQALTVAFRDPNRTQAGASEALGSVIGNFTDTEMEQLGSTLKRVNQPATLGKGKFNPRSSLEGLFGAVNMTAIGTDPFALEAMGSALDNQRELRQMGIAEMERVKNLPKHMQPMLLNERLSRIGEYESRAKLAQVGFDAGFGTVQTQQHLQLGIPMSDVDRARLSGTYAEQNLGAQFQIAQRVGILRGQASLGSTLNTSNKSDRRLWEALDEAGKGGVTGLEALQGRLSGPNIPPELSGATPAFRQGLIELVKELKDGKAAQVLNTDALKASNKLELDYLTYIRTPEGAKALYIETAGIDQENRTLANTTVLGLGRENNPYVSGSQMEGAAMDESQRLGREGDYFDSFQGGFGARFAGLKRDIKQFADVGQEVGRSLEVNLGNAFGDFVTGAKSGKAAFRDFAASVFNDAARAFSSKAVQSFLGLTLGNLLPKFSSAIAGPLLDNTAGAIYGLSFPGSAAGGPIVPSMLMGGEYVFNPQQAAAIGPRNLAAVNAGSAPRFAFGGMVRGGSGVTDDRPMGLAAGSFVVKRSSVSQYGEGYLSSLAARAGGGGASLSIGSYEGGGSVSSPVPFAMGGAVSAGSAASVNIGVTINDHRTTTKTETQGGGMDRSFAEGVGKQIRQVVIAEIANQTRTGGMLRRQSLANT